ncbi:YggN family protein [Dyella flagellata]|uniref:DUF2884 family protein n=1 Tax=Dyella flagellata TaxID=1867833 RepID=A0ABQ5X781_9GAMM|nr:hypothetical protein [Dyella flagellata]GLQ87054.1 hypothetical protein GCM10007898_06200 [Dyella flagellata]
MNYARTIALLALCATISACNSPDTTLANGGVTLKDDIVTLHAEGAPDAQIDANGTLQIDGKAVSVSPSQHGLLMLYFQQVMDVHQTGLAMGKAGAGMGMKSLKDAIDGKSKADKDKDLDAGGEQLQALGKKMCLDQANVKDVQDQLATQLPAFKPFAKIVTKSHADCEKD